MASALYEPGVLARYTQMLSCFKPNAQPRFRVILPFRNGVGVGILRSMNLLLFESAIACKGQVNHWNRRSFLPTTEKLVCCDIDALCDVTLLTNRDRSIETGFSFWLHTSLILF